VDGSSRFDHGGCHRSNRREHGSWQAFRAAA
jgi:hypothetical protein